MKYQINSTSGVESDEIFKCLYYLGFSLESGIEEYNFPPIVIVIDTDTKIINTKISSLVHEICLIDPCQIDQYFEMKKDITYNAIELTHKDLVEMVKDKLFYHFIRGE